METVNVSTLANPALQNVLFPGMPRPKLALRRITPEHQSDTDRRAARKEADWLARTMRVRDVHTHGDPILDVCDVLECAAEALKALKPSADRHEKTPSLMDALEMMMMVHLETNDAIDVICEKLANAGINWRELPCMQEPRTPTVEDYLY
jgi:hypothetical protein